MDKFELALLQINSAKKLATCYKTMLKQYIYVVAAEEVAKLMRVAQKYLEKAHRLEPREPISACLYAEQLRLAGQLREAETLLKLLDRSGAVELELLLCRGARDPASAIPELKGLHAPGLETSAQFHAGRLYEAQGRYREADMEYSSLLERDKLHMPTLYRKARLLLSRLNSPHLACIHLNTILAQYPHDVEILECKINALMSLGRHWDASNALRELMRLEPRHPRSAALQALLDSLANDSSFLALAKDSAQTLSHAVMGLIGWK
jgi:tetratricopeptide (TPR) repeat protein